MNSLKGKVVRNKKILENFSYLSLVQIFNLLVPFVSYPYLIRILGADLYGLVIFAQSIVVYFSSCINFGFNISATKNISIFRDNKNKISEIVSSVLIIKLLIWFICLLILLLLIFIIPSFKEYPLLYLFAFGKCFEELFFSQWFFQGVENMKYITLVNLISKTIFTILVFFIIKTKTDYLFVPLLSCIGSSIGGAFSIYVLIYKHRVKFYLPKLKVIKIYFFESLPFFISRITAIITEKSNAIIIGLFLGMKDVSYYDLASKIIGVCVIPFNMIAQAFYPKIARVKNKLLAIYVLKMNIILSVVFILLVSFFKVYIVKLLGGVKMLEAVDIVVKLSPLILIYSISYSLGQPLLIAFGHSRSFNKSIIISNCIYFICITIAFIFKIISLDVVVFILLFSEFINMSLRFYSSVRQKLILKYE